MKTIKNLIGRLNKLDVFGIGIGFCGLMEAIWLLTISNEAYAKIQEWWFLTKDVSAWTIFIGAIWLIIIAPAITIIFNLNKKES